MPSSIATVKCSYFNKWHCWVFNFTRIHCDSYLQLLLRFLVPGSHQETLPGSMVPPVPRHSLSTFPSSDSSGARALNHQVSESSPDSVNTSPLTMGPRRFRDELQLMWSVPLWHWDSTALSDSTRFPSESTLLDSWADSTVSRHVLPPTKAVVVSYGRFNFPSLLSCMHFRKLR